MKKTSLERKSSLGNNNSLAVSKNDDSQYFKHETIAIQRKGSAAIKECNVSNKMKCYEWFLEPQFYLVGILYVASRTIYCLLLVYMSTYYLMNTLLLEKQYTAIIPLTVFTSGLIVSGILKLVIKRIGTKAMLLLSCIVGIGKIHYNTTF